MHLSSMIKIHTIAPLTSARWYIIDSKPLLPPRQHLVPSPPQRQPDPTYSLPTLHSFPWVVGMDRDQGLSPSLIWVLQVQVHLRRTYQSSCIMCVMLSLPRNSSCTTSRHFSFAAASIRIGLPTSAFGPGTIAIATAPIVEETNPVMRLVNHPILRAKGMNVSTTSRTSITSLTWVAFPMQHC